MSLEELKELYKRRHKNLARVRIAWKLRYGNPPTISQLKEILDGKKPTKSPKRGATKIYP